MNKLLLRYCKDKLNESRQSAFTHAHASISMIKYRILIYRQLYSNSNDRPYNIGLVDIEKNELKRVLARISIKRCYPYE